MTFLLCIGALIASEPTSAGRSYDGLIELGTNFREVFQTAGPEMSTAEISFPTGQTVILELIRSADW